MQVKQDRCGLTVVEPLRWTHRGPSMSFLPLLYVFVIFHGRKRNRPNAEASENREWLSGGEMCARGPGESQPC